ncbi:LSU ribosomal protein L22p (L17e) [invertebrate metagenome]|uniref:LSU ribosomal protein L22p (L17e) n=1 Tax=invertebrate metagenome TaxID=1711999 RepID=A0A484H4A9_9ZZZZ
MGKSAAPRRLNDNAARATTSAIRVSPRKLNLVASSIRGLKADSALAQLAFSQQRVAGTVRRILQSAIANAENNNHLDVDQLYVDEAYVGKGLVLKRWMPRARSRVSRVRKSFSHLTIVVREREGSN